MAASVGRTEGSLSMSLLLRWLKQLEILREKAPKLTVIGFRG